MLSQQHDRSYLDINSESDVEGWISSPKPVKSYMTKEVA